MEKFMKIILISLFILTSNSSVANCNVHITFTDLVIGGVFPKKLVKRKLKKKGYLLVKDSSEANYSLDLHRSTASYEERPSVFHWQPDLLTGKFMNLSSGESIEIREDRSVLLLDLRRSQSLKKNVRRALSKLPTCQNN
jgi:hypothetical protein